jgi:diguanylate cyclase (GGDEF)-like protein
VGDATLVTDDYTWLTSMMIGRRQIIARSVVVGILGLAGAASLVIQFSAMGPRGLLTSWVALASAVTLLVLATVWVVRWPSRRQVEAFGLITAFAYAAACLSQPYALIGLGGSILLAVINAFGALLYSTRVVIVTTTIATAVAVLLGIELARRTGDPALSITAAVVVAAINVGLPAAVKSVLRTVRVELAEGDRDALTGLYHRRAFLREVGSLVRTTRDPDARLVLVVVDVDDFKAINDTAGHAAGDRALVDIAATLTDLCPVPAVIARYGGEEFAIADVLTDEQAGELTKHLCARLAAIPGPVPFTASVGWSSIGVRSISLAAEAEAIDALMVRADSAMYAAKRNGGNQVRHHPSAGEVDEFSFDVWLQRSAEVSAIPADHPGSRQRLDAAVEGVGLQSVFQPIVTLADRATIGFEMLTRWPQLDDPDPAAVLAQAESQGRTGELDRLCIASALTAAVDAGVDRDCWLFINTESSMADAVLVGERSDARLVFELTERRLLAHPSALLRKIDALRGQGHAIAMDDVGTDPDSLALLDIVGPDVIKLAPELIQQGPRKDHVRTLAAVLAHRARTNATILVEGIETSAQLEKARTAGATLGQGYLFGRPLPTPQWTGPAAPWRPEHRGHPSPVDQRTPFEIVSPRARVSVERADTLVALSRYIESQAAHAATPPIVLVSVQSVEHLSDTARRRFERLAASSPLVAVFGQGLPEDLGPRLRSVRLDPDDPLSAEWTVLVLGPDNATALISRERPSRLRLRREGDRMFATALTHDREVVTAAARTLLSRVR